MDKRKTLNRLREINARFRELADACEAEKRALTPDETAERDALEREKTVLRLRLAEADRPEEDAVETRATRSRVFIDAVRALRRGLSGDAAPEELRSLLAADGLIVPQTRDTVVNAAGVAPVVPLTIGDIIEPLEKGLILSLVGCRMQTGVAGAWQFPVVAGGVEAEVVGENVELTDKKIDLSKIAPEPRRVGISIPVSNRAIDQSAGVVLDIVQRQLSLSLQRLLNKWMFGKTQISGASKGVFVDLYTTPSVTFAAAVPTWTEVLAVEATVLGKGVIPDNSACWVCSASMLAALKAAPKDAGSGRFIYENGTIDGFPVFVTEYVEKDMLGFGVFGYALVGQFGPMRMTVDSTSAAVARKNLTYFVFNTDFDMLALRPEAFALGKYTEKAK